jgi:hypothetical protein
MAKFKVQMGEEDYRLVGPDGEEGVMVPYGSLASIHEPPDGPGLPPVVFCCFVDDPDDESPKVFRVDSVSVMPCEVEECDFPAKVVAAQRALDAALEEEDAAEESVIDVAPEVN